MFRTENDTSRANEKHEVAVAIKDTSLSILVSALLMFAADNIDYQPIVNHTIVPVHAALTHIEDEEQRSINTINEGRQELREFYALGGDFSSPRRIELERALSDKESLLERPDIKLFISLSKTGKSIIEKMNPSLAEDTEDNS